jgi:hypothetical protein
MVLQDLIEAKEEEHWRDTDREAKEKWLKNYERIKELLSSEKIETEEVREFSVNVMPIVNGISQYLPSEKGVILFDVSCFPKIILLSILRWIDYKKFTILYSRVKAHKESEEEFAVGVKKILPIKGFEGRIKHREDLLVLILGFEGYRAMSLFKYYDPYKAIVCIGDPGNIPKREFYRSTAREINENLLNNQIVTDVEVPSLDHIGFMKTLEKYLNDFLKEERGKLDIDYNIFISPLGTKPQTLGLFLYWLKNKDIQVVYSIPSKRRNSSEGIGETFYYSLEI